MNLTANSAFGVRGQIVRRLLWIACLMLALPGVQASFAAPVQSGDEFHLGVFPRRAAPLTRTLFEPLRAYLETALGRPVLLDVPDDYPLFSERLNAGTYDLVHLNPYDYVRVADRLGYRAIARNQEGGSSMISSIIVVRADSEIRKPSDLVGHKVLIGGGPSAMFSAIVPRVMLREAGLRPSDYFEQYAFSPPDALIALSFGQGDAACVGKPSLGMSMVTRQVNIDSLRVIAESAPMAQLPWAVSATVRDALRRRLQTILTTLERSEAGRKVLAAMRIERLVRSGDGDYTAHRQMIGRARLDSR